MNNAIRFAPWLLTAAIAAAFGLTWQKMNAQIEQKNSELSELQAKYNQLVSEANQKLQEANQRNANLAAEANEKLRLAQQPEVDVQISFRKALMSSGNVVGVKNTAGNAIAITAEVSRPSSGAKRTFELTIDPGQTTEIGEREGWAFISGDKIQISQSEHKSLTFTSP